MKKIITFCVLTLVLLAACNNKQQFTINGEIADATHQTLYLENVGTSKIVVLDSVTLTSGAFKFKHERPATPDFYRLRLGSQIINLAIDSTETITVKADTLHFATDYTLSDNAMESQKIKELTLLHNATAQQYNDLQNQYQAGNLPVDTFLLQAHAIIAHYKTQATPYITANFLAPSAYFALFQQINSMFIFDIYDKNDNKFFGAVANSWNQTYPESVRALQLKNIYVASRAAMREQKPLEITETTTSNEMFDITLPDVNGKATKLSEIGAGKLVLIDFTAYSMPESPAFNMQLNKVYDAYHAQGLEIYQISLDGDAHLWKNAAVNLPWICVRDPQAIYSPTVQKYNVQNLPTAFLRNRNGEIVARIDDYRNLNATIAKYLK
jgi:cytochrome oxidase Cu insertion factor (SCO1/SenC/PrrC family)